MDFYGAYKDAFNTSLRVLIDSGIDSLPVDIFKIAKKFDIKIYSFEDAAEIIKKINASTFIKFDGFCVYINSKWYIFYNQDSNVGRIRFTIAHELGHILLGHKMFIYNTSVGKVLFSRGRTSNEKSIFEIQADQFAARLLAPAVILKHLNLHSTLEIKEACNISFTAAKIRANRMQTLYKRNKFYTNQLEYSLYLKFENFLKDKCKT